MSTTRSDIAVVGFAGRFPGAPHVEAFWENLCAGVESIARFTDQELASRVHDPAVLQDPNYVRASGALDGVELFDADFFGLTGREAELLDPQHRILLEVAWEALEHAGHVPSSFDGQIGVFAGAGLHRYLLFGILSNPGYLQNASPFEVMLGNDKDFVPTRISYKLDLRGPSVNVQTACSTSLVAVHLACQSLLHGECDMALAGGVSVAVPQGVGYVYEEGAILSPDGHCRAFDAEARGTVGGSGAGMVVLRRLEDALRDGDPVVGVIRGSAINNDGALKVGYTAPSVDGQAGAIAEALEMAEVPVESIGYVEAHGTGTPLGDPVEIAALTQAYREYTDRRGFCAIGSLKSNVGHLDTAAGVAGLIKTLLVLERGVIPPTLHFRTPNPQIDFAGSPFFVNAGLREWARAEVPRRAGVSSFGIGGTNAHVVVEEAPPLPPSAADDGPQLLVLSARTSRALDEAAGRLRDHLARDPGTALADVAFTLQAGRAAFAHRRALVCRGVDDAVEALAGARGSRGEARDGEPTPVVFLFPGQGTQHPGMGRELYEHEPVFREVVDRCAAVLRPLLGVDLREVMYAGPGPAAAERLRQTAMAQPALFVTEYALARLWMDRGVHPEAMLGHSLGEYVAACLAGVMELDDALALVAERGRLMQAMEPGAMLSVLAPEPEARAHAGPGVSVAAVNAPGTCVLSGPVPAIERAREALEARGVVVRRLETSHAFHSAMMEPMLDAFRARVARVRLSAPRILYVSNRTGRWIRPDEAVSPEYWVAHVREAVRFADGVREVAATGEKVWLEVGPGQSLGALVRPQVGRDAERLVIPSMRPPREPGPEREFLLEAAGRLWTAGVEIGFAALHGTGRRRLHLPTYPFQRQRYWIDAVPETPAARAPGRRGELSEWFSVPTWERSTPARTEQAPVAGVWLILAGDEAFAGPLAERLEADGARAVRVRRGGAFHREDDGSFALRPGASDDYAALLAALRAEGASPAGVVHGWTLDGAGGEGAFFELMALLQAVGRELPDAAVQVSVATRELFDVLGTEAGRPHDALALGIVRVAPREYPGVRCRLVDGAGDAATVARAVAAELRLAPTSPVVAYRGAHRWVEVLRPAPLPASGDALPAPLRPGGHYLVTGGLGGIGLELAGFLARETRARITLVSRSAFPARDAWDGAADAGTAGRVRRIREMEAAGAEVEVLRADVADAASLRDAVERARVRFGPVHGAVHAAGVPGAGVIQAKTVEGARAVMAPKVEGTVNLRSALEGDPLDFALLCSSLTAFTGDFGQADYCGANAFQDAFARAWSAERGVAAVAVNWGAWRDVGMAARTEVPEALRAVRERELRQAIAPAEGAAAFARVLVSGLGQVVVSPFDPAWSVENTWRAGAPDEPAAPPSSGRAPRPRPELPAAYVPPEREAERATAAIWRDLLDVEPVGLDDDFFALGGNSLVVVQLLGRLRQRFQTSISAADIFDRPTLRQVAARVDPVPAGPGAEAASDALSERLARGARMREQRLARRVRP